MRYVVMLIVLLLLFAEAPMAQNTRQDLSYANNGALGFYIGYPVGGITGIYNPNARLGLQGIVDVMGSRQSISGRVLYRFLTREHTNTFGYGMAGGFEGIADTSFGLGFGAGAGVEYSWQSFSEDLPPIWGSAELGITSWDSAGGATTRITFSAGIYYYF